ncbi:MAG: APC family permease [Nocardioidaceae bacterium]|nr:APC family permease [Nocardioidaceae bacterium]
MGVADAGKRILLGRKLRSTQLGETLLPKRVALPVFASDALSSVAYSPDEIFLVLAMAGLSAYTYSWKVAIAVAIVLAAVVTSYRQNVQVYTSGGGDYEVTTTNLGPMAGLGVGSALLVDYVLTVAVSISSAAQYAATAVDPLEGHQTTVAVAAVLFLMAVNLRGVRESGRAFAVPTYLFMAAIIGMSLWGFLRYLGGDLPQATTAELRTDPEQAFTDGLGGFAFAFLLLRAFSSGCAALTGVEAISNGVPAFRKPKGRNAANTLLLLGVIAITMIMSVITLANLMNVRIAEDPANDLLRPDGTPVGGSFHQDPVIGQLAEGIFADFPVGFFFVTAATGVILVLAANTAYNGFPVLGSILAQDGYLPRQLQLRGDRLAFSNGIVALALFAIVLIVAFDAEVTQLIQLYIVGVFVSFTASQAGMIRHWNRALQTENDHDDRRRMVRSRAINAFGFSVTALVLVVVLVTKFLSGAWIAILAMAVIFFMMRAIHRHYDQLSAELEIDDSDQGLPSRVHAIVLVSKLHKPAMRALSYARASRPNVIEAISVDVDPVATARLLADWDAHNVPVPLKVLSSPYREIIRPTVSYVRSIRRESPRDIVTVFIPEYVVGRWWEQLLHNQTALRLKGRLLFTPGVMVTSVPWLLESSVGAEERADRIRHAPGDLRRGYVSGRAPGHDVPVQPPDLEAAPQVSAATGPAGPDHGPATRTTSIIRSGVKPGRDTRGGSGKR